MRRSIAALGLISREERNQPLWLAQWNQNWNAFSLIGGHKRDEESFRECLIREINEELGLTNETDFEVAQTPLAHLEHQALSERSKTLTAYVMEIFQVRLVETAISRLREGRLPNRLNRWLRAREILAGRTTDGQPISPTVAFIFNQLGLLQSSGAEPMPHVYWLIAAQRSLLNGLTSDPRLSSANYQHTYERLCRVLARTFPQAGSVVVRHRLHGYRNRGELHVLLVEVFAKVVALEESNGPTPLEGNPEPRTIQVSWPDFAEAEENRCRQTHTTAHIVKIVTEIQGSDESHAAFRAREAKDLEKELGAWERVRPIGMTHHGILMMLRCGARDAEGRLESIAYESAHHVLGGRQIVPLEEAVLNCVRWGVPTLESVKLAIKCVYEQLGTDFYSRSYVLPTAEENHALIRERLAGCVNDWKDQLDPTDVPQQERFRTRREVDSALCAEREGFLDPADYLQSVLECPRHCPLLLWGAAHGDLHGMNVLLSIAEGDATLPAVFDYEDMGRENVIGWDFVKMEVELKVRALALLLPGTEKKFLETVFEFERYLARRTQALHDQQPWTEQPETPGLTRLAELVMAIRTSAYEHLGRRRHRDRQWLESYYFLLAYYSLCAGKFETYQRRHVMAAWIGGGVAARLLTRPWYHLASDVRSHEQQARNLLDSNEVNPANKPTDEPFAKRQKCEMSHVARLEFARVLGRSGQEAFHRRAAQLLATLRQDYPHVLEIEEELALQYLELNQRPALEELLDRVSRRYNLSEEMLCRMGRYWKTQGLEKDPLAPHEAALLFQQALIWYQQAYELRQHYYPGINVATLHFLLGQDDNAREMAQTVLTALRQPFPAKEMLWVQATEAEARLLLGEDTEAQNLYHSLRADLPLRDRRSARRQIEPILRHLPEERRTQWTRERLDEIFGRETA